MSSSTLSLLWLVVASLSLGRSLAQTTPDPKPLCFQTRISDAPNSTTLADFISPAISQACNHFNQAAASSDVITYNKTGYFFAKLNIDGVAAEAGECENAFTSILTTCVQAGSSFGGQWSPQLELSYILSNVAYPGNPLVSTRPPTTSISSSSTGQPGTTSRAGSTASGTGTKTSSSVTSIITSPPAGGGGHAGRDVIEAVAAIAAAAAALLAVSFLPGANFVAAVAAVAVIEKSTPVIQNIMKPLPPTAAVTRLTGALEAARFAGVVARTFPNPVPAGMLITVAGIAVEAAVEVAEEADKHEEEEQQSSGSKSSRASSTSSTTSSPTGGPTPHVVAMGTKWPDLIVDAISHAFPDDGKGRREDFKYLGIRTYVTNITDFLGDAVSILPIFTYIESNDPVVGTYDDEAGRSLEIMNRNATDPDTELFQLSQDGHQGSKVERTEDEHGTLVRRWDGPYNSEFPAIKGITFSAETRPQPHLPLVSQKWPTSGKTPDDIYHYLRNSDGGEGVTIFVVDSGFGSGFGRASSVSSPEFRNPIERHVLGLGDDDVFDSPYLTCVQDPGQNPTMDDDSSEYARGHGTCVASVAGSIDYGVAKNANIVVYKHKPTQYCTPRLEGWNKIFDDILAIVDERNLRQKAIINYSIVNGQFQDGFRHISTKLAANDVIWVVAAGQESDAMPKTTLDYLHPASLADLRPENIDNSPPLIVVSGVTGRGDLDPRQYTVVEETNTDPPDRPIIAVYARYYVNCLDPQLLVRGGAGTSYATPAVSGLIAEWLSNPKIVDEIKKVPGRTFSHKVRNFLRRMSVTHNPSLPKMNMLYNGYRDKKCNKLWSWFKDRVKGRYDTADSLKARDDANSVVPVLVDGTVVDTDFGPAPTCTNSTTPDISIPPPTSTSSASSVSSSSVSSSSRSSTVAPTSSPTTTSRATTSPTTSKPSITSSTTTRSTSSTPPVVCSAIGSCEAANCNGSQVSGVVACRSQPQLNCPCKPSNVTTGFNCGAPQLCDKGGCAGKFDSQGVGRCTDYYQGCQCLPTTQNCGNSQNCTLNHCDGTFDNAGSAATCKNWWATCPCKPTPETCGTPQLCSKGGCEGSFDNGGTIATCKGKYATCRCLPTDDNCGSPQPCTNGACAGTFDADGTATCKGKYAGCKCSPTAETCGEQKSCDTGGCTGTFDDDGKATCKGAYKGCQCKPTANTCGDPQSCEKGNCAGTFNSDGKATCKGYYATCPCKPTEKTCGNPQLCDKGNCGGSFDDDGVARCKNYYATCECEPTVANCGQQQNCDAGGCDGKYDGLSNTARCTKKWDGCTCKPVESTCGEQKSCDSNGCDGGFDGNSNVARCRGNFKGCKCTPTPTTCGDMRPCTANGCAGTFDYWSNEAHCRGNFAGCKCNPVIIDSCGKTASCEAGGCGGTVDDPSSNRASCKGMYRGCPCDATSKTPGFCSIRSCSEWGCTQTGSEEYGTCWDNGCPCVNPGYFQIPPQPPPVAWNQPPAGWSPNPKVCKIGDCMYELRTGVGHLCKCICNDGKAYGGSVDGFSSWSCNPNGFDFFEWATGAWLCWLFKGNIWLHC